MLLNDFLLLWVLGLVTHRLARLIAIDEGPKVIPNSLGLGVFELLRYKLGALDRGPDGQPKTHWGRGVSCPHCVGLWVALPLSLIMGLGYLTPVYWVGIAGIQSLLQEVTQ